MPRSFIKGSQVRDESITDADLADNAVITRTIKDKNVTKPKLADDVCARLLDSDAPIARICLTAGVLPLVDFTLPGGKDYRDLTTFLTRTKIWQNGQLLFNGDGSDLSGDTADVIPGSDTTKVKFLRVIERGAAITVEVL